MSQPFDRRSFLRDGMLVLAGGALAAGPAASLASGEETAPKLLIGVLTDCHYADRAPAGSRVYRESLQKVRTAVDQFNEAGAKLAIELGDFIDAADDVQAEIGHLQAIEKEYARFHGDRHYVLGNHCVFSLTKEEFVDNCQMPSPHYSFDHSGLHFVVLDACYRKDGAHYGRKNYDWTDANIPRAQLEWLAADLQQTKKPTLAFIHQRLDVDNHYGVRNAAEVRKVLEESQHVLAVFQGHNHVNDYRKIGGIHYCTLNAVVEGQGKENNAYAVIKVFADGSLHVDGFRRQKDYQWPS